MNKKQRTDFIIQQYLDGILHLIERHENEKKNENSWHKLYYK